MVDTVQGTLITPGTTLNLSNLTLQGGLVTSNVSLTTGTIVQTGMYTPDGTNLVLVSNSAQQINIAPSGVLSSLSNIQTTASLVATNLVGNGTISGAMVTVGNVAVNAGVPPTNGMYLPAANTLALASGSTQRLTISPTGNVGIGSSTPAYTMDVAGNVRSSGTMVMASPFTMRNKIINGAMVIDQRNAGAAVSPAVDGTYYLDRWRTSLSVAGKYSIQQNAGSVTPPSGFSNYLGITSLSAYTPAANEIFMLQQRIEGYNTVDLAWGTSSALSVTLSFWVRSSLTGTFGGSLTNGTSRSYPFTYTISLANTWEQKTITVAGDTTGTWLTSNGLGVICVFGLGVGSSYSGTAGTWAGSLLFSATGATSVVGTNGATFYLTGVQLEIGSVATPFELRNYQQELAMCQRYYCKTFAISQIPGNNLTTAGALRGTARTINASSQIEPGVTWRFPVSMRATPGTITLYSPASSGATNGQWTNDGNGTYSANARTIFQNSDGMTIDNTGILLGANQPWIIHASADAEL